MTRLPAHLHCVYVNGGFSALLARDFDRDWSETGEGASVVFNDQLGEFTKWRNSLSQDELCTALPAFCRLGVVIERCEPQQLILREDGYRTLFVWVEPSEKKRAALESISRMIAGKVAFVSRNGEPLT